MRLALAWAFALMIVGLAGCTAGDDPNTPPNADPNPQESLPPVSSTSSSTGPPDTNSTTASSSSAAPAPSNAHFEAVDAEDNDNDGDFPGLFLGGHLQGSGSVARVEASANNVGERTYRVPSGCGTPWTQTLTGPSGPVALHAPQTPCSSPTHANFLSHDSLSAGFEWNGTVWDAATGTYVPAESGSYTWHIAFDVYSGSGTPPPEHATLTLDFEVTLG